MTAPLTLQRLRRSAPGRVATEAARHGVRAVGAATAAHRPGPDLLIVGAKRGGTTSMWHYLGEHPGVLPLFPSAEHLKGLYYFADEYERGPRWYRSHFATREHRNRLEGRLGHRTVAAEASPYYLFHPLAPARAAAEVPDALVLVLLRDPVERAFSHWKERRRHTERLGFAEAVVAEPLRIAGEERRLVEHPDAVSFAHRHQTYVTQSRYAAPLTRWFDAFGRERVEVVVAEEFFADPQRTMDRLHERLGLPSHRLTDPRPHNAAPSPDMDPVVRADLERRLAPDVARLEDLLGRPMPWSTSSVMPHPRARPPARLSGQPCPEEDPPCPA